MVLEAGLRRVAEYAMLVGSLCVICACQTESASASEDAAVGATVLTLSQSGEACMVGAMGGESIELGLSGPCYFARMGDRLLTYAYPQFAAEAVVGIIGDPISEEARATYGLDKARECGSSLRVVVVNSSKIALAPAVASGGLFCRSTLIDEKNFYGLAESFFKSAQQVAAALR